MRTTHMTTPFRRYPPASASLVALLAGAPALAQEAPVVLDEIVLEGQESAVGPVDDDPNPSTVTGSKAPLR